MQSAYPTTAAVQAAIEAQGFTSPSNLATILSGVIAEFERRTGFLPFLGASVATEHSFDPPYRIKGWELDLLGGFWTITSIYAFVSPTSDGTLAVEGTDYDLMPINADTDSRGWDRVRFLYHPGFGNKSIVVTGKRGWGEEIPDDVYQAIFDEATWRGVAAGSSSSGAEIQVKQGMREVRYESGTKGRSGKALVAYEQFESVILRFVRP